MVNKRGDTLIEVALAIGIFSLVAVAVVAVVSGSTSAAQSALEITITREEIDAQAEALRFIHTSYIAGGSSNLSGDDKYVQLWEKITENAIDPSEDISAAELALNYNPSECQSIYNSEYLRSQGAFVIDTHNLGAEYDKLEGASIDNIVISSKNSNGSRLFSAATTYPRMVYGGNDALLDHANGTISAVEGIFVVAVRDAGNTTVVGASGTRSAYYDFYIRTCWFAPGSERPSTISTVIRLQDPEVVTFDQSSGERKVKLVLDGNGNNGDVKQIVLDGNMGDQINLGDYQDDFTWNVSDTECSGNVEFVGWSSSQNATPSSVQFKPGNVIYTLDGRREQKLYAIWRTYCPCCFWFDVNASRVDSSTHSNTGGVAGFNVGVYVNDKLVKTPSDVNWDVPTGTTKQITAIDWYTMVPLGSKLTVWLYGRKGAYIDNKDSLCSRIGGCEVSEVVNYATGATDYKVTFQILPEYLWNELDSSGHYSIRIEPQWDCTDGSKNCFNT